MVLRSASPNVLDELERAVDNAVNVPWGEGLPGNFAPETDVLEDISYARGQEVLRKHFKSDSKKKRYLSRI